MPGDQYGHSQPRSSRKLAGFVGAAMYTIIEMPRKEASGKNIKTFTVPLLIGGFIPFLDRMLNIYQI
jgi:hypothetical protein